MKDKPVAEHPANIQPLQVLSSFIKCQRVASQLALTSISSLRKLPMGCHLQCSHKLDDPHLIQVLDLPLCPGQFRLLVCQMDCYTADHEFSRCIHLPYFPTFSPSHAARFASIFYLLHSWCSTELPRSCQVDGGCEWRWHGPSLLSPICCCWMNPPTI